MGDRPLNTIKTLFAFGTPQFTNSSLSSSNFAQWVADKVDLSDPEAAQKKEVESPRSQESNKIDWPRYIAPNVGSVEGDHRDLECRAYDSSLT